MLDYAFGFFNVVWFHIGPTNIRSQKAILKIGAEFTHEQLLNITGTPRTWGCYKIEKQDWMTKTKMKLTMP